MFFFAAIYGQIALAEQADKASLLILYFFLGFVVCAQIGGRMLDRIGAKRPVVLGCALAAVGFGLWASRATDLHTGAQWIYIVMAGAGMGLMLGQANTDAINRASRYSYGEATGITQTVRNYRLVGTGSLAPASWAIRSAGIRGYSPAGSRVNTSSLVPTPSTWSSRSWPSGGCDSGSPSLREARWPTALPTGREDG